MEKWKNRLAAHDIDAQFLTRMSTRAFDPNKAVDESTLNKCFEAARWAPSCFNSQPWRYLWAAKGSQSYQAITQSMVDFNQIWCKTVPVLCVICSRQRFTHNDKLTVNGSLDTGASYMSLVLQATKLGLAAHAMAGFNKDHIREAFKIPEVYHIEALLALGYPGDVELLPSEMQAKEMPSDRMQVENFVSEGTFPFV